MTLELGNSWRGVYVALNCPTSGHDDEPLARDIVSGQVNTNQVGLR